MVHRTDSIKQKLIHAFEWSISSKILFCLHVCLFVCLLILNDKADNIERQPCGQYLFYLVILDTNWNSESDTMVIPKC